MKQFAFILSLVLCLSTVTFAQSTSRADELMQQAQTNLKQKEYIKARYLFLQAYNAFSSQEKYDKAVECGVNASALYHRENYYKEAFELLRGAELLVTGGEQKSGKAMPDLRFRINKERLQMYINLKNPARAKEQLTKLEETAKAAKNDSLNNDLLYTQANYYYTFGMNSQGDAYINRLIGQYKEQKNYAKVDESYKTLIDIARKANNAGLVARTYDKYILWTDSVRREPANYRRERQLSLRQAVHHHWSLHPRRTPCCCISTGRHRIAAFRSPYPEAKESHPDCERAQ